MEKVVEMAKELPDDISSVDVMVVANLASPAVFIRGRDFTLNLSRKIGLSRKKVKH